MSRWYISILLLGLSGFCPLTHADHLPDELLAHGRPETRLAGIDLRRAKLAGIIKRYGKPSSVKEWESGDPKVASSYDYYWNKHRLKLKVVIVRLPGLEYVSFVNVKGPKTLNQIGATGAGLKLGDSLSDLKRLYGHRFKERNIQKLKIHDVMIQWHPEEYSLVATLDRHNRITGLSLAAPE